MKPAIILLLPCLMAVGCTNEAIETELEPVNEHKAFTPVGNPVEVKVSVNPTSFMEGVSTRAEHPVEYEPRNSKEMDAFEHEQKLKTIWVFEFDQETGDLIHEPYYTERGDQDGEEVIHNIHLSDNLGKEAIIYVIVNADGINNVEDWCTFDEQTGTYPGFMTVEELEAQLLPTTYDYEVKFNTNNTWPPYYFRKASNIWVEGIPKSGKKEHLLIHEEEEIKVDVENMYAKLLIYFEIEERTWYTFNIEVENIPCYCTVGPLADSTTTTAAVYPNDVRWTYFTLATIPTGYIEIYADDTNTNYTEWKEEHPDDIDPPALIIYVPENIQGEYENSSTDRDANVPQLSAAEAAAKVFDDPSAASTSPSAELVGVSGKTNALAVQLYLMLNGRKWYGPIYPGGNNMTNFNVRRNCSYRVVFDFVHAEEY